MLRYLTNKRKEARREINGAAVHRIYDRARMSIPADSLICHGENSGTPNTTHPNFRRNGSRAYAEHSGEDGAFSIGKTDYEFRCDGSLRVINKPRSRAKRLREENYACKQTA